jgi:hypothetical protein
MHINITTKTDKEIIEGCTLEGTLLSNHHQIWTTRETAEGEIVRVISNHNRKCPRTVEYWPVSKPRHLSRYYKFTDGWLSDKRGWIPILEVETRRGKTGQR